MPAKQKAGKAVTDSRSKREAPVVHVLDCSTPAADGLIDEEALLKFAKYFEDKIKVNGKTGQLGDKVKVSVEDNKITISKTKDLFPKRYIKFLTRKFLKQEKLRDYLRPVSTGKADYQLRYYNIHVDEEEEA
eukprot:TRINITY_DN34291_c0_g1_i1.p2 TRINITY_DN34291_c0_g1~~TRINITY_DN34291_c0_g1_i1.p2  ORF type:complete len:132 (+),score=63.19 TRINITY_DN34291_c0_g1_i1:55-450(+)